MDAAYNNSQTSTLLRTFIITNLQTSNISADVGGASHRCERVCVAPVLNLLFQSQYNISTLEFYVGVIV